jgi:predicted metalloprotease with PDZ domain
MNLRVIVLAGLAFPGWSVLAAAPMTVQVDLRDAPRGIIHAALRIPTTPGPLTLLYPQWIPGEHGPTGPIVNVTGMTFSARGNTLAWRRDLVSMFTLHLDVPAGVDTLEAHLDYLSPTESAGYSAGATTSARLAILNWNLIALYPAGKSASDIEVSPSVRLPEGWQFGTSLQVESLDQGWTSFKPVSLEMLIDQPVIAGAHFRHFDLTPGANPPHVIDCAADSEAALAMSPERLQAYRRVPLEYAAMLGARFYTSYHFLLALSDRTGYAGVEHHQCSDNRAPERSLIDEDLFADFASMLTHEYFHSWNGKHRRPLGLLSADYQKPMRTDLLWVYEGLTEYYGDVMAARARLIQPAEYREYIALVAARLAHQKGRLWRPLQDTADEAQILYLAPNAWSSRRRGTDFYDEGELIWLEADVLIRTKSTGARSLDDFCRLFLSGGTHPGADPDKVPGQPPSVSPYVEEDVYAALNRIQSYDWKNFFRIRLTATEPLPPLAGIAGAGWNLAYDEAKNLFIASEDKINKTLDLRYSLGMILNSDSNLVVDVIADSPADKAGLAPGMSVLGVNGRKYSDDRLMDALKAGESEKSIRIIASNDDFISEYPLTGSTGPRFPHLERIEGTHDALEDILRPLAH